MTQNSTALTREKIEAIRLEANAQRPVELHHISVLCDMALAYLDHLASPSATGDAPVTEGSDV